MSQAKRKTITLTTDFGSQDGYVGVVKGVILGICDAVNIVDLSHDLPAWDVSAAAWIIGNSYSYFPAGTIHLGVVDPEVGSMRRAVALEAANQFFIGPDNGIFSKVLKESAQIRAFNLNKSQYWLKELSSSFHARDIFAPVSAHLASGIDISEIGTEIDPASLSTLPAKEPIIRQNRVEGSVSYVDHFGNLITNISGNLVKNGAICQVGKRSLGRTGQSYFSGTAGAPVAFIGSHGYLEIAVSHGSAAKQLEASIDTQVIIFNSQG